MGTGRRADRNRYFEKLPSLAFLRLLAALFFTFSSVGIYTSLLKFVLSPWWVCVFWAVFVGLIAIGYSFVIIRRARWIPAVIAAQVLVMLLLSRVFLDSPLPQSPLGARVAVHATAMLAASLIGFALFFHFIKSEGANHVRIETELSLAHRLQETLVPPIALRTRYLEIYGGTLPSEKVGGDLVDCIQENGCVLAYAADVSGHGIPAGVLMGMLKAAIRMQLLQQRGGVAALLKDVNQVLPAVKEPNMYATLACLQFDEHAGSAEYSLAGHPPILRYRANDGEIVQLKTGSVPLGLVPSAEFSAARVEYAPGDLFVVLTDGCIEAANAGGEEFGLYRLELTVLKHARESLDALYKAVLKEIHQFGKQEDDQSVLLIRVL